MVRKTRGGGWPVAFLILAVLGPGACSGEEDSATVSNGPLYRLQWMVEPYDEMTIFVNEIPAVEFRAAKDNCSGYLHINWFLRDGANGLSVVAEKPNGRKGTLTGKGTFSVHLYTVPRPDAPSTGRPLFQVETSGQDVQPTLCRSATINAHIPFEWSWQKAAPIEALSEEDRAEILGQIKALRKAHAEKDAAGLERLLPLEDEIAKSLYLDEVVFKKKTDRLVAKVFGLPDYSLKPIDFEAIELTVHGPVVAAGIEGRELIEAGAQESEGESSGLAIVGVFIDRMLFMKLDGAWVPFALMM